MYVLGHTTRTEHGSHTCSLLTRFTELCPILWAAAHSGVYLHGAGRYVEYRLFLQPVAPNEQWNYCWNKMIKLSHCVRERYVLFIAA